MKKEQSLLRDATGTAKLGDESKIAKYIRIAIVYISAVFSVLFLDMGVLRKYGG
jgi:hypothetical protein